MQVLCSTIWGSKNLHLATFQQSVQNSCQNLFETRLRVWKLNVWNFNFWNFIKVIYINRICMSLFWCKILVSCKLFQLMKSIHSWLLAAFLDKFFLSQGTLLTRGLVYAQIVQGLPCQSLQMIHRLLMDMFSCSQFMKMFKIIEAKRPRTLLLQNSSVEIATYRWFSMYVRDNFNISISP